MKQYQQPELSVIEVLRDDVITASPSDVGYGYQEDIFGNGWEDER